MLLPALYKKSPRRSGERFDPFSVADQLHVSSSLSTPLQPENCGLQDLEERKVVERARQKLRPLGWVVTGSTANVEPRIRV